MAGKNNRKKTAKGDQNADKFEIVPQESGVTSLGRRPSQGGDDDDDDDDGDDDGTSEGLRLPPRVDPREYDSDEENYDQHDRAMTLALGTMMLRQSRKKALVDASYNRFSWNDPGDLPSWFSDDEMKHNKPQLPVPSALLDQIKNKFQVTGTKEIKKVAEARMRKRKRAMTQLKAAKRQAAVMVDNAEMSEKQKIKAIARAMKGAKSAKPGKVYVVTSKQKSGSVGTSMGGKGKLKFVDKRSKKDARATRANKKRGKK